MIASLEQITKYYGAELILDHVSLKIEDQDRIGLIGVNGHRKSTLLKLVAGLEEPDTGTLSAGGTWISGYLPQNPVFEEGETVLESVLRETGAGIMTRSGTWKARQRPC